MVYTKMEYVHYYGDVIITKIDAKGNLVWEKKMPKTQVSIPQSGGSSIGGLSIKYIKGKDAHYILYLDNPKNAIKTMVVLQYKYI